MKAQPYLIRDFRGGRVSPDSISSFLAPENSVKNSINVNFDEIIGSAKVRPGTVKLGATVASAKTPLGLFNFIGKNGTPNYLLAVFTGVSNGTLYYYDTSWHTSSPGLGGGTWSNTLKNRFASLGGRVFVTNTSNGMVDSVDALTFVTTNSIGTYKPALVYRYAARLLAAGDPTYPDRLFFSSVIDPTTSPLITWNVNTTTGDWIDINPDDGGYITGFSEASTFLLVFKTTGMYRVDTLSKTTSPNNIFNVGAVSQEAITLCQGVTYYFSGLDIRRTNGGYSEQISRLGVQDFIDAIPYANWSSVALGTDQLNVYVSIGTVTLNKNQDNERMHTNVVLKFSPRDQTWSPHSYADTFKFLVPFTTTVTTL